MIALTVIAMKAEEEKQILAAAGFTALAISFGINILCLFDIADVVTFEQYERYYRITVSTYFLLIVSTFLIGSYYKFKLWIRYYCIISVIPFLIVSILFLFGVRDYNLLEFITNFGVIMFSLCWIFWAYNIFFNYQKDNKKISEA